MFKFFDRPASRTFEVGKSYYAADSCLDPITVIKRNPKSLTVTNNNGRTTWRMLIRVLEGVEYVMDSSLPKRYRDRGVYAAAWEVGYIDAMNQAKYDRLYGGTAQ